LTAISAGTLAATFALLCGTLATANSAIPNYGLRDNIKELRELVNPSCYKLSPS
jgi:hypothetical protein